MAKIKCNYCGSENYPDVFEVDVEFVDKENINVMFTCPACEENAAFSRIKVDELIPIE